MPYRYAIKMCTYLNIFFLFKILVTLPVSTTTPAERSFLTLKIYRRNSINTRIFIIFRNVLMDLRYYQFIGQLKINPDKVIAMNW